MSFISVMKTSAETKLGRDVLHKHDEGQCLEKIEVRCPSYAESIFLQMKVVERAVDFHVMVQ